MASRNQRKSSLGLGNKQKKKISLQEWELVKQQRQLRQSLRHSNLDTGLSGSFGTALSTEDSSTIVDNPPKLTGHSTVQLREFIHEQRKIISSFRSQPWPMYSKIEAIRNYKANVLSYVPQLSTIDAFRDKSSRAVIRERQRLKAFIRAITIWRFVIKKVEGNFGTSVGSYFRLVRWVCVLNIATFLLALIFIILPQIAAGHGLQAPEGIKKNVSALSFVFDGEGYLLEYSVLFYGYYDSGQNETFLAPPSNPEPYIGNGYKLPLAYALVIISTFVLSGGTILYSIAKKYKLVARSTLGRGGQYTLAWRVFAGWDYAITDNKTAIIKMKQHGIALKELLFEITKEKDKSESAKIKKWIIHILTNSLVTVLLLGTGYAIFAAAENSPTNPNKSIPLSLSNLNYENIVKFLQAFQLQIVITLRNFLTPLLFKFIALHEQYHPRTALNLRLLRLFILYFSSLYVVLISLFIISGTCAGGSSKQDPNCRCWETNVGQEMYKLMLIQTLTEVGSILFVEGAHWLVEKITERFWKNGAKLINRLLGNVEFEISVNVLKLVYGQGLILFGILFCPFLPAIGFLRNVLIFYLRTLAVFVFDKPPVTFFRVASTHNFYMGILLVTVFISSFPVGFAMIEMKPSLRCGPFRGLNSMITIITNDVNSWPPVLRTALDYVQQSTVVIPVITVLCIVIYYYASLATALKEVNKDLALQLSVEQSETRKILAEHVASKHSAANATSSSRGSLLPTSGSRQTSFLAVGGELPASTGDVRGAASHPGFQSRQVSISMETNRNAIKLSSSDGLSAAKSRPVPTRKHSSWTSSSGAIKSQPSNRGTLKKPSPPRSPSSSRGTNFYEAM